MLHAERVHDTDETGIEAEAEAEAEVEVEGGEAALEPRSRDRIQSLERGVHVLRAFGGRDALLSVAEIALRVELARPVVRRILITFEHLGYTTSVNGMWSLTPRVLEIGSGYFAASSLPQIAYGYMEHIVEVTGEACSVGVLDEMDVIHVARVEDRRPLPDSVRIGNRLPAHATATGRVLLADLDEDALEERLEVAELQRHTPATITDTATLRERIALVRERGYDVSLEDLHPGQVAAAVPIVIEGRAVGGLAVSSTTVRETEQSLVDTVLPVLTATAAEIASAYRNANPHLFRTR
jgi:IclR family transcriptional regulator, pca regulon regulatory protein